MGIANFSLIQTSQEVHNLLLNKFRYGALKEADEAKQLTDFFNLINQDDKQENSLSHLIHEEITNNLQTIKGNKFSGQLFSRSHKQGQAYAKSVDIVEIMLEQIMQALIHIDNQMGGNLQRSEGIITGQQQLDNVIKEEKLQETEQAIKETIVFPSRMGKIDFQGGLKNNQQLLIKFQGNEIIEKGLELLSDTKTTISVKNYLSDIVDLGSTKSNKRLYSVLIGLQYLPSDARQFYHVVNSYPKITDSDTKRFIREMHFIYELSGFGSTYNQGTQSGFAKFLLINSPIATKNTHVQVYSTKNIIYNILKNKDTQFNIGKFEKSFI